MHTLHLGLTKSEELRLTPGGAASTGAALTTGAAEWGLPDSEAAAGALASADEASVAAGGDCVPPEVPSS